MLLYLLPGYQYVYNNGINSLFFFIFILQPGRNVGLRDRKTNWSAEVWI